MKKIQVLTSNTARRLELESLLPTQRSEFPPGVEILLIDEELPDWTRIASELAEESRAEPQIRVLLERAGERTAQERQTVIHFLQDSTLDDLLKLPLTHLEWELHQRRWRDVLQLRGVSQLTSDLEASLNELEKDLAVAKSLQIKSRPERFESKAGLEVASRYWAGTAGSEYYDMRWLPDERGVVFLLLDSDRHGVLGALLQSVARVIYANAFGIPKQDLLDVWKVFKDFVRQARIDADSVRFLLGHYSTHDQNVTWLNDSGFGLFWLADGEERAKALASQSGNSEELQSFELQPDGTLLIASDGFAKWWDGVAPTAGAQPKDLSPKNLLSEIAQSLSISSDPLESQEKSAIALRCVGRSPSKKKRPLQLVSSQKQTGARRRA